MTRLEGFLASGLLSRELLAREQAGLEVLDAAGPAGRRCCASFPPGARAFAVRGRSARQLMMSYDVRGDPHGLLEDLKSSEAVALGDVARRVHSMPLPLDA